MNTVVRPAQQARSQATLERLEQAALRLLSDRSWSELRVSDLVREANSSIGSFYARFHDKEALLEYLDERYTEQMLALAERYATGRDETLADAVRRLVDAVAGFHRERRGLIRALVLRARSERAAAWDARTRRMNDALPRLLDRLLAHRDEIRGPDPERVAFLGFSFMFGALRERVLFPESVHDPRGEDDQELRSELSRLLLAYLTKAEPHESP